MAAQGKIKDKLLVLKSIMEEQTSENHALTVQEIIRELGRRGIPCERKTVYEDIAALVEHGVDIVSRRRGHSNEYFLASRLFQTEELLILADATASSRFLTMKKSKEIIGKLRKLTDRETAETLQRSVYVENRVKSFNEKIYYTMSEIHDAIRTNRKLTFRLSYYDINKKLKLRHDGKYYKVSPIYLTWEEDKYYLICLCEEHGTICSYRVDRMQDARKLDEKRDRLSTDEAAIAKSQLSVYGMYRGTEKNVTMEFDSELMNVVIDRFGEKVICRPVDENRFRITADVQISPPFWGWLFKLGDKAKIISPDDAVLEAKQELKKILALYE